MQPTLVTGAHSKMRVAQEEVFGPFLTVIPFKDEKDAIEIANGVQYGLTGYVWTGDMGRALRVADALEAGMIWLNSENVRHLPTPFGGMKSSGIGRDGGDYSFDFYMETKHVSLARGTHKIQKLGICSVIPGERARARVSKDEPSSHMVPGSALARLLTMRINNSESGNSNARSATHLRPAVQHHSLQPRRARCRRPRQEPRVLRDHRRPACRGRRRQGGVPARQRGAPASFAGVEESPVAACSRLGFKVGNDGDLDKAAAFFSENGIAYAFADQPFQGRTLQFTDPAGFQLELYATMDKRPHLLRRYDLYKGCHPQRLDHFNVFAAEVQNTVDFYARLGFRLTEYGEEDGPNGRIAAAWMHRKGNVHDFAITNGRGPRLHHFAYWTPTAMNILHLCDVMASSGYLKNIERGPGRHGISNAFFLYVRDPDGHRLELYTSDYFTGDHDHEPLRWSLKDPRRQTLWGAPAPRSWFEEGSPFTGQAVREPAFVADVTIAD